MSDAVDQAINQIEFSSLTRQKVYLDTQYLKPVSGGGPVNADYIISSLRQQMTAAGCLVQEYLDDADIVIEPRVGALGTDGHEVTYGIPQNSSLTNAATALSGSPSIPVLPEISFGRNDALSGVAKIIIFAYDRESKQPVWQSGIAQAESSSNSMWILGAGPFQRGSIYEGVRFAGKSIEDQQNAIRSAITPPPLPVTPRILLNAPDPEEETPETFTQLPLSSSANGPQILAPQIHYDDKYLFDLSGGASEAVEESSVEESAVADDSTTEIEEGGADSDVQQAGFEQPAINE